MAETGKGVTAGKLAINVQKRLTRAQEKVNFSFRMKARMAAGQRETQPLNFYPQIPIANNDVMRGMR